MDVGIVSSLDYHNAAKKIFVPVSQHTHTQEIFKAIKLRVKVYVQAVSVLSDKAKHFSKIIEPVSQEAKHFNQGQA